MGKTVSVSRTVLHEVFLIGSVQHNIGTIPMANSAVPFKAKSDTRAPLS